MVPFLGQFKLMRLYLSSKKIKAEEAAYFKERTGEEEAYFTIIKNNEEETYSVNKKYGFYFLQQIKHKRRKH